MTHMILYPETYSALLKGIETDSTCALAKQALADLLEESGCPDLAYAYRWAAKNKKHPYKSAETDEYSWWLLGEYNLEREKQYGLKRWMLLILGVTNAFESLDRAFYALAMILRAAREDISI